MDITLRPPAASFSCVGLGKCYEAEASGRRWRHAVLRYLSLAVRAGRCTAIVGLGLGPVTVLRCMAGLTVPERGTMHWRDASGRPAGAPRRALITAGWRPYGCHTVRDVLEQAVPAGLGQTEADARVAGAALQCALPAVLGLRAAVLPPAGVRLVATAAAIVSGASWLLLDRREAGETVGPWVASADAGAVWLERLVLQRLARSGLTIVAAGPVEHCASLAPAASIALAAGRLERRRDPESARRVAEHPPSPRAADGESPAAAAPRG
ncbi:MAG: hypothetical protein ACYC2G_07330 [Gemmatimonadaceae bacterium]